MLSGAGRAPASPGMARPKAPQRCPIVPPLGSLPAAVCVSPRAAGEQAGLPADGTGPLLWLFAYGILIRPIIFPCRQLRFICFVVRRGLTGDILMPATF